MSYKLLHNPNCSTSRKGLELLKASGIEPQVRKYMNETERLTIEELKDIAAKLDALAASQTAFLSAAQTISTASSATEQE